MMNTFFVTGNIDQHRIKDPQDKVLDTVAVRNISITISFVFALNAF